MAKTIKFNLICDGHPVRTIEDLQNNFSIEDVLAYYNNRLLHRWLKVRGYQQLNAVSDITSSDPSEIIKELIRIFEVVIDMNKVEERIQMFRYLEERKERCDAYEQKNYKVEEIIKDYEKGYNLLVSGILTNPDNVGLIKANIAEIVKNYAWILELDHRALFYKLLGNSPLAIMCLLMNEQCRKYYLPVESVAEDGTKTLDTANNVDKSRMYDAIKKKIADKSFLESLGDNLVSFSGETDGYWKDLEPAGRKFMIVSMNSGDYVRSASQNGGGLSYDDVKEKFVFVDGIDYKSNYSSHILRYMPGDSVSVVESVSPADSVSVVELLKNRRNPLVLDQDETSSRNFYASVEQSKICSNMSKLLSVLRKILVMKCQGE